MDPNRELNESCFNFDQEAAVAYNDYHVMIEKYFCQNMMQSSTENKKSSFKHGLLIDLHGQSHPEQWIELGYLLTSNDLNQKLNDPKLIKKCSIRNLLSSSRFDIESLVRGEHVSLGAILQEKFNYQAVPSPLFGTPNGSNYYSGGYITEKYSSSKEFQKYRINAIQIELPSSLRKPDQLELHARKIAKCLFEFYVVNLFDQTI
jgi:hypothetical protein